MTLRLRDRASFPSCSQMIAGMISAISSYNTFVYASAMVLQYSTELPCQEMRFATFQDGLAE